MGEQRRIGLGLWPSWLLNTPLKETDGLSILLINEGSYRKNYRRGVLYFEIKQNLANNSLWK